MSEWCVNELKITGSKEEMNKFYTVLKSENDKTFSMNKFVPFPEDLKGTDSPNVFRIERTECLLIDGCIEEINYDNKGRKEEQFITEMSNLKSKYGYDNSYDWKCNNWGCKWDVNDPGDCIDNNEEFYGVMYDTPSNPNIMFVIKLHEMFENLSFELNYHIQGMGGAGTVKIDINGFQKIEKHQTLIQIKNSEIEDMILVGVNVEDKLYCELIPIVIEDWDNELLNMGLTKENIENWNDVEIFFIKQNEMLVASTINID